MPATASKTAEKFRSMADKLSADIAAKRRGDRRENTPKQVYQATVAAIDANHLDRVRNAMVKLADAHEAGTVPAELAGIRSKVDLAAMLRTRVDAGRNGYYSIHDTGEYADTSATAVALREFLETSKSALELAEDCVRSAQQAVETMGRLVAFTPIAGFFSTKPPVVARMLELADLTPGMSVLEPSAGKGDIAEAARAAGCNVLCVEVVPALSAILLAKGLTAVGGDFLTLESEQHGLFDRVLMNPPFEGGADIDHVRHAYRFLKPGGRLVAVMSTGPFFRGDKKATAFREWLAEVGGERHELPDDAFKGGPRSTGTRTNLVGIDRN